MPRVAAKIPDLEWNDLRYVLAVARAQAIAPSAKTLRVNETTVLRRLARAELALGSKLFDRLGGTLLPTAAGYLVITHAERVEAEIHQLLRQASGADSAVSGVVRVTSIAVVVHRLLIPALAALYDAHPGLRLEISAEPRNLSLTRRDADIALRLARPDREQHVIARRIGDLGYALYRSASKSDRKDSWITYESGMATLPHVAWIDKAIKREPGAHISLTVNDSEIALHAIQAGLGKSLLPCLIGDSVPGLRRLSGSKPVLSRELWLLALPETKGLARIKVVSAWLEGVVPLADRGRHHTAAGWHAQPPRLRARARAGHPPLPGQTAARPVAGAGQGRAARAGAADGWPGSAPGAGCHVAGRAGDARRARP